MHELWKANCINVVDPRPKLKRSSSPLCRKLVINAAPSEFFSRTPQEGSITERVNKCNPFAIAATSATKLIEYTNQWMGTSQA